MATTFPTSLQALTNVTDNVDYPEASTVNNLNDTVEALESKVGVTGSAVSTSHDYILKNKIWPIGSVFLAVVATDPATLIGFGTWTQIAGGKMLVGQTDGDADFNVAEETGGAKTHTLSTSEMPVHTHVQTAHTHTSIESYASFKGVTAANQNRNLTFDTVSGTGNVKDTAPTNTLTGSTAPINQNAGSGGAHSILNPYFTVFIWKRVS